MFGYVYQNYFLSCRGAQLNKIGDQLLRNERTWKKLWTSLTQYYFQDCILQQVGFPNTVELQKVLDYM